MKILRTILQVIKWIIITLILVFSLATFMGKAYAQTLILVLAAVLMAYWPAFIQKKMKSIYSKSIRVLAIIFLLVLNFTAFKAEPKESIFCREGSQTEMHSLYDECMESWPSGTEDLYVETKYGRVHYLRCGSEELPPLVMIHAASMGAHSWAENLEPLLDHYCIYSFDNIGEANKSQLKDATIFPNSSKELAAMYASILDSLGIDRAPVFGASNGGFIAQLLGYYYPEKVESLALFGPMGLTQLTKGSYFMLSVGSMYPFKIIRKKVAEWGIGKDVYVQEKYGRWFDNCVRGSMPSVAAPVPMTTEQKKQMTMPVLLFLGTEDNIVGDAEEAKATALDYPNIEIEILESGHLIAVEEREVINEKVKEFLGVD